MEFRRFGKTELRVPVFTFGGMRIPFDAADPDAPAKEENAIRTICRAVELGLSHLETARGYGNSEELFGKALNRLNRAEVLLTTKIPPADSESQFRQWLDDSLTRMNTGYLDNFDLHGINTEEKLRKSVGRSGTMRALRKAMDEGLIRHVGFSTHGPLDLILKTIETREFESVNLHYYYFDRHNEPAVERAAELDMGVFIISPTDKGGLLHRPPGKLSRLAAPYSPAALLHRFLLADERVHTLSLGAATPEEFALHLAAADRAGPLTDEELRLLNGIEAAMKDALGDTWCSVCFDCLPCPEDIHIPEALRLRNLAGGLDMMEYGRYRYKMFENAGEWYPGKKGDKCTECGDCLPRCPLRLDIPALLRETHAHLAGEEGRRLWADTVR